MGTKTTVSQTDAIGDLLRKGVYFEQMISEMSAYSEFVGILHGDGRFMVITRGEQKDYWTIEAAVKAFLDAVVMAKTPMPMMAVGDMQATDCCGTTYTTYMNWAAHRREYHNGIETRDAGAE